ncbi:MAG: LysR substrate-binding domain-containing protein [Burkholderia sp.]
MATHCAGLGIARGYRFAFQPHLDTGALREILPACRRPPQPVRIVYYPSRRMSNRLRVFLDWLRDAMAEALGEGSVGGEGWRMTEAGEAGTRHAAG